MTPPPVLAVVGGLDLDQEIPVERRPVPGEAPLRAGSDERPGGRRANRAAAAAGSGTRSRTAGRGHRDAFGDAPGHRLGAGDPAAEAVRRVRAAGARAPARPGAHGSPPRRDEVGHPLVREAS